jgi:hypothetical protein
VAEIAASIYLVSRDVAANLFYSMNGLFFHLCLEMFEPTTGAEAEGGEENASTSVVHGIKGFSLLRCRWLVHSLQSCCKTLKITFTGLGAGVKHLFKCSQ